MVAISSIVRFVLEAGRNTNEDNSCLVSAYLWTLSLVSGQIKKRAAHSENFLGGLVCTGNLQKSAIVLSWTTLGIV